MQLTLNYNIEPVEQMFLYNFGEAYNGKIACYKTTPTLYDNIYKGVETHTGYIRYFRRVLNNNPYEPEEKYKYQTIR